MNIALKYRPAGGDPGGVSDIAQEFNALRCIGRPSVERISGQTLRRVFYAKRVANRVVYDLAISADELVASAKYTFLKDMWATASRIWIATEKVADVWQYVEVVFAGDGNLPATFIGGNVRFPEVAFELQEVEPA